MTVARRALTYSALSGDGPGPKAMKADTHPKYERVEVTCACGNKFETRSTKDAIKVDTGQQRFVDTAGRVDKFRQRYGRGAKKTAES